jgi:hypothetical protein
MFERDSEKRHYGTQGNHIKPKWLSTKIPADFLDQRTNHL